MSKHSWEAEDFVPNPDAHRVVTQGTKEERKQSFLEPRKEDSKQETKIPRKRSWEMPGQDEWIKANFEVPRRIQTKLNQLKAWGLIKNIKDIVPDAIERALDEKIAKAEKEGY